MKSFFFAGGVILTAAGVAAGAWQTEDRSARDGVYTTDQADQGKQVYEEKCGLCHGSMQSFTPDVAPLLNDYAFQRTWTDRSIAEFFERIRDTMPQDAPGTLSPEQLVDLIAYILSGNRMPAGNAPLPADVESLTEIRLGLDRP